MSELTAAQAAALLRVSSRQVARLAEAGQFARVRRVGTNLLLDAEAVQRLAQQRRSRGRPWAQRNAWAALTVLSGEDPGWISASERTRLLHRLRRTDAEGLPHLATARAQTQRFRCHPASLGDLKPLVVVTGLSALGEPESVQLGITLDRGTTLDGYVPHEAMGRLVHEFLLKADPAGSVTLRSVTVDDAFIDGRTPWAAVVLDMAESLDTRERSAGMSELTRLLEEVRAR